MSSKPETTFYTGVHKHLPHTLYRLKTHTPYVGGIPDIWYSGARADLWVEYKYIPKITPKQCALPDLSPLQLDWLNRRHAEGRNVAVITGHPDGGVILRNRAWEKPLTPEQFRKQTVSRQEIARWIVHSTQGP